MRVLRRFTSGMQKSAAYISVVAILGSLFSAFPVSSFIFPEDKAVAADLSFFNPGYIISDTEFYDYNSMTTAQIQSFLVSKGSYLGRTDVRYSTVSKAVEYGTSVLSGQQLCGAFSGGRSLTTAEIIWKLHYWKVNPKVILVTLQKEQRLITKSTYDERALLRAMGYACPDSSVCDTQYFGVFNQIYHAIKQFRRYQDLPHIRGYQAGRYNYIQYNPSASCGGSNVYRQNQATAALYVYTPYQPNAASLAAGYGGGAACGAYGNRNFFSLTFTVTGLDTRLFLCTLL